jgi:hypothetical protein
LFNLVESLCLNVLIKIPKGRGKWKLKEKLNTKIYIYKEIYNFLISGLKVCTKIKWDSNGVHVVMMFGFMW